MKDESERLLLDLQGLEPWNFKRNLRRLGLVIIVWLIAFAYAMHRPWGDPRPGLRLEPAVQYPPSPAATSTFYDLLDEAVTTSKAHPLPDRRILNALTHIKYPLWKASDAPTLAAALEQQAPALALATQAAAQPLEECGLSLFLDDSAHKTHWHAQHLTELLRFSYLLGMWQLAEDQPEGARAQATLLLALGQRLSRGGAVTQQTQAAAAYEWAFQLVRVLIAKATTAEALAALDALLAARAESYQPFSETLRYELIQRLADFHSGGSEATFQSSGLGKYDHLSWLLGCSTAQRERNLTTAFAEMIDAFEQTPPPPHPEPIITKRGGSHWNHFSIYKSDPIGRWQLYETHSLLINCAQLPQQWETHRRLLQAVQAVRAYELIHDEIPPTLADAMPVVPLDLQYHYKGRHDWNLWANGGPHAYDQELSESEQELTAIWKSLSTTKRKP